MSSHREAFELFRRAIENMPASLSDDEKVEVLLLFSDAAGNIDRNALMADFATRAREIALRIGDALAAIEALGRSRPARLGAKGRAITGRRDLARRVLNEIDAAPGGPDADVFGTWRPCSRWSRWTPAASPKPARCISEAREVAVQRTAVPSCAGWTTPWPSST